MGERRRARRSDHPRSTSGPAVRLGPVVGPRHGGVAAVIVDRTREECGRYSAATRPGLDPEAQAEAAVVRLAGQEPHDTPGIRAVQDGPSPGDELVDAVHQVVLGSPASSSWRVSST